MGLLQVVDRTFLLALVPTGVVLLVTLARGGRPRLGPYVVWAFAAGVWGAWVIVAPEMLLAFGLGLAVGWLTAGRIAARWLAWRRSLARRLLGWANRLDPDRPWSRADG